MKKLAIVSVIAFGILSFGADVPNEPKEWSTVHEPPGYTMNLIPFEPKMIFYPFAIDQPESWYVREVFDGIPRLWITKEPVRQAGDIYTAGVSIQCFLGFFIDQTAQTEQERHQNFEQSWSQLRELLRTRLQGSGGVNFEESETLLAGKKTYVMNYELSGFLLSTYIIAADKNAMVITTQAPARNYEVVEGIFDRILNSILFYDASID